MIVDPFLQRELGRCLYLTIPIISDEKEMRELIADAMKVEHYAKRLMKGELCAEEYLEAVEPFIPNFDDYIDSVEDNIDQEFGLILD